MNKPKASQAIFGWPDRRHTRYYGCVCLLVVAGKREPGACAAIGRKWVTRPNGIHWRRENGSAWSGSSLPDRHHRHCSILFSEPQAEVYDRPAGYVGTRVRRAGLSIYELRCVAAICVTAAHRAASLQPHHQHVDNYVLRWITNLADCATFFKVE